MTDTRHFYRISWTHSDGGGGDCLVSCLGLAYDTFNNCVEGAGELDIVKVELVDLGVFKVELVDTGSIERFSVWERKLM